MNYNKAHSDEYGTLTIYEQFLAKKPAWEITIYLKVDEAAWKYFNRTDDGWSDQEVDWSGYLLGAKTLRLDFEQPEEWGYFILENKLKIIENEIGSVYAMDDWPSYHVEPVSQTRNYVKWSDKQLWELERILHDRKAELEKELRDINREYHAVWAAGGDKYNWGDRL